MADTKEESKVSVQLLEQFRIYQSLMKCRRQQYLTTGSPFCAAIFTAQRPAISVTYHSCCHLPNQHYCLLPNHL